MDQVAKTAKSYLQFFTVYNVLITEKIMNIKFHKNLQPATECDMKVCNSTGCENQVSRYMAKGPRREYGWVI